jgi:hypothetical protein
MSFARGSVSHPICLMSYSMCNLKILPSSGRRLTGSVCLANVRLFGKRLGYGFWLYVVLEYFN